MEELKKLLYLKKNAFIDYNEFIAQLKSIKIEKVSYMKLKDEFSLIFMKEEQIEEMQSNISVNIDLINEKLNKINDHYWQSKRIREFNKIKESLLKEIENINEQAKNISTQILLIDFKKCNVNNECKERSKYYKEFSLQHSFYDYYSLTGSNAHINLDEYFYYIDKYIITFKFFNDKYAAEQLDTIFNSNEEACEFIKRNFDVKYMK